MLKFEDVIGIVERFGDALEAHGLDGWEHMPFYGPYWSYVQVPCASRPCMLAAKLVGWEVRMESDIEQPKRIPIVDPEDLKDCWNHHQADKAGWGPPKPGTAYGLSLAARFRDLDVQSITYRLIWLLMLEQLSEIGAVEFQYFPRR
jgi:hypothetical protein